MFGIPAQIVSALRLPRQRGETKAFGSMLFSKGGAAYGYGAHLRSRYSGTAALVLRRTSLKGQASSLTTHRGTLVSRSSTINSPATKAEGTKIKTIKNKKTRRKMEEENQRAQEEEVAVLESIYAEDLKQLGAKEFQVWPQCHFIIFIFTVVPAGGSSPSAGWSGQRCRRWFATGVAAVHTTRPLSIGRTTSLFRVVHMDAPRGRGEHQAGHDRAL